MNPAWRLLHSKVTPLAFCHQVGLGNKFSQLFGKDHMSWRRNTDFKQCCTQLLFKELRHTLFAILSFQRHVSLTFMTKVIQTLQISHSEVNLCTVLICFLRLKYQITGAASSQRSTTQSESLSICWFLQIIPISALLCFLQVSVLIHSFSKLVGEHCLTHSPLEILQKKKHVLKLVKPVSSHCLAIKS